MGTRAVKPLRRVHEGLSGGSRCSRATFQDLTETSRVPEGAVSAAIVLALGEPTVASIVERQAGLEIEVGRERGLTADEVATTLAR